MPEALFDFVEVANQNKYLVDITQSLGLIETSFEEHKKNIAILSEILNFNNKEQNNTKLIKHL